VKKKFNWSTEVLDSINWEVFKCQARKQHINRRTNLLKFVYEWLPIGKILQHIDQSAETKCPSCDTPIKTHQHIFCCPKKEQDDITKACINQISELCTKWNVGDDLSNALQTSLTFWVAHPSTQPPSAQIINLEVWNAMKEQQRSGGGTFSRG
jgi:hypothetical protein